MRLPVFPVANLSKVPTLLVPFNYSSLFRATLLCSDTRSVCIQAQLSCTFTGASILTMCGFHSPAGLLIQLCSWEYAPPSPKYIGFDGPLPFPTWVPCGLGPAGDAGRPDTTPRKRQSSLGMRRAINLCIKRQYFQQKTGNWTLISTGV